MYFLFDEWFAVFFYSMPVRGHTVFWGKEQFVPEWLKSLSTSQVVREMVKHAECTVARTRDRYITYIIIYICLYMTGC